MVDRKEPLRIDLDPSSWLEHWRTWIDAHEAQRCYEALLAESDFTRRTIILFGKPVVQPRDIAWAGDRAYTYSRDRLEPRAWPARLAALRDAVNATSDHAFNHALLNHYLNGTDSMGAHSDDEPELGDAPVVASVSFGAKRRFVIRHKRARERSPCVLDLAHGDLLVMRGDVQRDYRHALPKSARVHEARLNVTFRRIVT